jgi:hypothetical protein
MPRRLAVFAVASFAALMSLPSSAQSMKPGLWEIHNKIGAENGELARQMEQMQKQLASMPPEQRKMMEEMMAKHGGAGMPTVKDGGMVVKVCVSKEMVAQNQVPVQQQGNCTNTRSPITGGTMKMSFVCTKPDSSGEGEIQFMGDTGYRMKMKMKSVVKGKPETMSMDATGKFMGSDCGTIKPMAMPPQK